MRGQFQPDFGEQGFLPEGPAAPQPSRVKKAIPWLKLAWRTKWFLLLFLLLGWAGRHKGGVPRAGV